MKVKVKASVKKVIAIVKILHNNYITKDEIRPNVVDISGKCAKNIQQDDTNSILRSPLFFYA